MIGRERTSVKALVLEANKAIKTFSQSEALDLLGREDVVFVDIRDIRELKREGMIDGALHVPRGMVEFWVDPESPYHKPLFAEDKTFIFYCASAWRSALATKAAQDVGLINCGHLEGGFTSWLKAGNRIVEKN